MSKSHKKENYPPPGQLSYSRAVVGPQLGPALESDEWEEFVASLGNNCAPPELADAIVAGTWRMFLSPRHHVVHFYTPLVS